MQDDQKNYWQKADASTDDAPEAPPSARLAQIEDEPVTWTAQEYVHLPKGPGWYVIFAIVVVGLIAADLLVLKSYTFSALVVVMAIALIVYIRRPARTIQYALSVQHGLYVAEKLHDLSDFKAFGIIRDGAHFSIMLIPTKRFASGVSVYFPGELGEQIVDILGSRLPIQELKLDAIDRVVRLLRL